ncbi:AAA family ATPase [Acinetobacter sp. G11]|uniref:AAA family ATPase n=2 Tax=Acinetobacter TaxID=469 RepID=UPI003C7EAC6C
MELTQGLLIKQLVLHGYRKNYIIPFKEGINIIHGDADTGKSSILRFINYLLGGKSIKLDEEISSSVNYAVLEIVINDNVYCISRDIFNASRDIDVYSCTYSEIKNNFPEKYISSVSKSNAESKSLSEFLIETLGFPSVKLKQAPTKDSSETARLSFLDLFKFMYLDQDEVGSKHMLNMGNFVLETKNREVLKYIFNILDSNISEIEVDISNKSKEKSNLNSKYLAIAEFFSQTEFSNSEKLNEEIDNIEDLGLELNIKLKDINSKMISDNNLYHEIRDALSLINIKIDEYSDLKNKSIINIENFTRLSNDYKNDVEVLKAGLKAKEVVGGEPANNGLCPICDSVISLQNIKDKFEINDEKKIRSEISSINRRIRDLKMVIEENTQNLRSAQEILNSLYLEQNKAKELLDDELKNSISPYLSERDIIVSEIAQLNEKKDKAYNLLKIRNKHDETGEKIARLEISIEKLKVKLEELKENTPSVDNIVNDISLSLDNLIKKVKIYNHYGVEIDSKTFWPKVRNTEYKNINSGGLRTIISISYLASILEQKLSKDTNLPGLLMIDTVGKFLGKTYKNPNFNQNREDVEEGVSDPEKYKNLFNALIDLAEKFKSANILCQMILVDNDLPPNIDLDSKDVQVISFSSSGVNGLPIGLIDDWDKRLINAN